MVPSAMAWNACFQKMDNFDETAINAYGFGRIYSRVEKSECYFSDENQESDAEDLESDSEEAGDYYPNALRYEYLPFTLIQIRRRLEQVNEAWNSQSHFIEPTQSRTCRVAFRPENELVSIIECSDSGDCSEEWNSGDKLQNNPRKSEHNNNESTDVIESVNHQRVPACVVEIQNTSDKKVDENTNKSGNICTPLNMNAPLPESESANLKAKLMKKSRKKKAETRKPAAVGKDHIDFANPLPDSNMDKVVKKTIEKYENLTAETPSPQILSYFSRQTKAKIIASPRYPKETGRKSRLSEMYENRDNRINYQEAYEKGDAAASHNFEVSPKQTRRSERIRNRFVNGTPRTPRQNEELELVNKKKFEDKEKDLLIFKKTSAPQLQLNLSTENKPCNKKNSDEPTHDIILNIFRKKTLQVLNTTVVMGSDNTLLSEIKSQVAYQNIPLDMLKNVFSDRFLSAIYSEELGKSKWATKPDFFKRRSTFSFGNEANSSSPDPTGLPLRVSQGVGNRRKSESARNKNEVSQQRNEEIDKVTHRANSAREKKVTSPYERPGTR